MTTELSLRISFGLVLATGAVFAQPSSSAPLAFEVATIKPSAPLDMAALKAGAAHIGTKIDAARVDIGTASLFRLICTAYRVRPYQVTGPDWLKSAMYDIQAKIPAGGTTDQIPEMLQTLLGERFGLKVHHESREQPVYALTVASGGPKMKDSAPEPPSQPPAADASKPLEISMPTLQGDIRIVRTAQGISLEMPGGEIAGKIRLTMNGGSGQPPILHLESSGTSMKAFAQMLSVGVVERPVVDMTGLTGRYEVAVDVSQEEAMNVARAAITYLPTGGGGGDAGRGPGGAASDPSESSIFKSVQRLGLKLEPRRLPLDMLIVEHVEKTPASN